MSERRPRRNWYAGLLLVAVASLALPGAALAEEELGWRLRFYLAALDFENSSVSGGGTHNVDVGAGLGVNAEYRFNRRFGLDLGVLGGGAVNLQAHSVYIGHGSWYVHDTVGFTPLTVGLDIHLTPDVGADLYISPLLALIRFGGLAFHTGHGGVVTAVDFEQDLSLGLALGLGVPFGQSHWSFQAHFMYLDGNFNGSGRDGLRLSGSSDVLVSGLGFGYRF